MVVEADGEAHGLPFVWRSDSGRKPAGRAVWVAPYRESFTEFGERRDPGGERPLGLFGDEYARVRVPVVECGVGGKLRLSRGRPHSVLRRATTARWAACQSPVSATTAAMS